MTKTITRSQAKESGLKTYFTGKPCPRGHVAYRKTFSGSCVECSNESTKEWRSRSECHMANYGKSYRQRRGEDLLARKREYQRKWNAENKDEKSRRDSEYERVKRESGDVRFLASRKAISKKYETSKMKAMPAWADNEAIQDMYFLAQVFRRVGVNMHVDHIVPLQGKKVCGLHTHHNLQLLAGPVNQSKSNRYWPDMP
jgi:hypothetical protein